MNMHKQIAGVASLVFIGAMLMANAQPPKLNPETFLPPAPAWSGASEKLIAREKDAWITPSEKTGLTATPTYDETVAWLKKVDKQSKLLRIEPMGTTPQGRRLVTVILSKDGASFQPSKPVFLIQVESIPARSTARTRC
jgi:hypothetical protein